MKSSVPYFLVVLLCVSIIGLCSAADVVVWSAKDGFAGVGNVEGATMERTDGAIALKIDRPDCKLFLSPSAPFVTLDAERLVVKYRAMGTGPFGGQFYYARVGERFSDLRCWRLPSLKADGEWHVMSLGIDALTNKADWFTDEPIVSCRYDPTNSAGGRLEIAEIRLTGGERRGDVVTKRDPPDPAIRAKYDADLWPDVESEVWKGAADVPKVEPVDVRSLGGTAQPSDVWAGEQMVFRYDFTGPMPTLPFQAQLVWRCGTSVRWREDVHVTVADVKSFATNRWRVTVKCRAPLYLSSCRMDVSLKSEAFYRRGGVAPSATVSFTRLQNAPGFERPVTAGVATVGGAPRFTVNGKPFYALWGTAWPRGTAVRHSDAPLNVVTVWTRSGQYWPKEGVFDPSDFDFLAELNRRAHPDAWFIWDLTMYPPPDWAKNHPDEMARDENGRINTDGGDSEINYSFASKRALADIRTTMEKAIAYLESSPYANRIIGYRINSGHTAEWLGWDPVNGDTILDFSPVAQQAFEAYAKRRYPSMTDFSVPPLAERRQIDGDELLWDPVRHIRPIAYHRFYSDIMAEDAIALCRRAKEMLGGKKLIGTYFGYVATLFGTSASHMRAHYSTAKVLESGAVDFLMSPQPYAVRNPGDVRGDMKPFKAIQNRGIVSVVEDDTRTFNSPRTPNLQMPTEWLSTQVLRRNMAQTLCRNEPFYTYALCSGTEFDYPQFAADAAAVRKIGEHCLANGVERHAEIAVVVSEEAMKALPMITNRIDRFACGWQQYKEDASGKVVRGDTSGAVTLGGDPYVLSWTRYARIGAPVDYLLAEDLPHEAGNYRLYIFNCCHRFDKRLAEAAEKLRQRNCMILWTFAPGYMCDDGNSLDAMKRLTGMEFARCPAPIDPELTLETGKKTGSLGHAVAPVFYPTHPEKTLAAYADGKPGLAMKKTGSATTVFSGTYRLEVPVLVSLVKEAGVHLYSESSDPVDANDRLVALHARFAGRKTIRLPGKTNVYDVFNRRMVARGVKEFSFDAPLHSSWLFYCSDDADVSLW
ncbi:MAG: hypothetical protein IJG13_02695 [Kiritimatiellae bacterium]|nr:hypothetical protein [Kiritimatiellia bacterium]